METIWQPRLADYSGPLYRAIAEALAEDIRAARLAAGSRLPTMRALAEKLEVTVGTVYRAYELAEKQGLIVRELGRGSFVRETAIARRPDTPRDGTVDLSRNAPLDIPLGRTLQRTLREMGREPDLEGMLNYGHSQGQPHHRETLAGWIRARGYAADPERLIVTSGAQQALTIALGALARAGDSLLVEELTYPGIKNLAHLFGLRLRPLRMDRDGLIPEDFAVAAREPGARLLYCMPNVHNPTTATLTAERRQAVAAIAAETGLVILEDDVYPRSAATPLPAFADLYPNHTVYISSLSKTLAPGLRVGALLAPARLHADLVAVTQTTSWMAPPLMAELACRWIADGTVAALDRERDRLTNRLHQIAATALAGLPYRHEPRNNHFWLPLAQPWSGGSFAARAAEAGVRVAPAEDFAIDPSRAPAAVRLCLPNIAEDRLAEALSKLAALAKAGPGPAGFRM